MLAAPFGSGEFQFSAIKKQLSVDKLHLKTKFVFRHTSHVWRSNNYYCGFFLFFCSTGAAEPAPKRKDEMIFSDDDNFLDGLGIDADDKKKPAAAAATPAPAAKAKSAAGDSEDNRPAKSVLDGLLGRGQKTASSLLETKEKPRTFVLDKKYTQPKEGTYTQW